MSFSSDLSPDFSSSSVMRQSNLICELFLNQIFEIIISIFRFRAILSRFTDEQMSRYESFRRSNFQKSNMKRVNWEFYRRITNPKFLFNEFFGFDVIISSC